MWNVDLTEMKEGKLLFLNKSFWLDEQQAWLVTFYSLLYV